jgi:hypothetical protein
VSKHLLDLAERCEAATGPDRELDCRIHCAVKDWPIEQLGNEFYALIDGKRYMVGWLGNEVKSAYYACRTDSGAPLYTASLDAAETLVPNGYKWSVFGGGYATVEPWSGEESDDECGTSETKCATPALALTAAALRSRAELARKG